MSLEKEISFRAIVLALVLETPAFPCIQKTHIQGHIGPTMVSYSSVKGQKYYKPVIQKELLTKAVHSVKPKCPH